MYYNHNQRNPLDFLLKNQFRKEHKAMYESKIRGKISVIDFADLERAAAEAKPERFFSMDWMTLGPFVMETGGALETEFLYQRHLIMEPDYLQNDGGETGIVPYLGKKCVNSFLGAPEPVWEQGRLQWGHLRFAANDCDSACPEALYLTEQRNCVYYAAVYVHCQGKKRAVLCYQDSGSRVFLNGKMIADTPYGQIKGVAAMGRLVPAEFHDGLNLLLFKIRPGYICDIVDYGISSFHIWPVAAQVGNLALTHPTKTGVFVRRDGESRQVFPCVAAAFGDTEGGKVDVGGYQTISVDAMDSGSCKLLRPEVAAGEKAALRRVAVSLASNGKTADGSFTVKTDPAPVYRGKEIMLTMFHFDTTYYQEQRVYALGAIHLVKEILEEMRRDDMFKAVISEVDYLHPYYSLYPHDRELLKQKFMDGHAESDCFYNQPNELTSSPEGIVRNMLYGQLYHRDVLGRICDVYGPGDVFGHFNQMSQVSAKGGCNGVYWGKHIFGFPPAFRHVSPDGTNLIHIRGGINRDAAMQMDLTTCMGGGNSNAVPGIPGYPVDGDLSWTEDCAPKGEYQVFSDFRKDLQQDEQRLITEDKDSPFVKISRDMSLYHAGTALTRMDLKQANRMGENLLISAEKFATMASLLGAQYPEKALDKAWRQLLCGQHHDSITGTNNEISFVDLLIEYREAVELAADVLNRSTDYIASCIGCGEGEIPVVVFNPHTWDRSEPVTVELTIPDRAERRVLRSPAGVTVSFRVLSCEQTEAGYQTVLQFKPEVPAFGYAAYALCDGEAAALGDAVISGSDTVIENEFYRITVDPEQGGGIVSLFDKENVRELVNPMGNGPANRVIALKEVHDRMETQHEIYTTGHRISSEHYTAQVRSEKCADYQKLTITYDLGTVSPITQELILNAGSRRIDFTTRCDDYQDEDDLFCVTFPTTLQGVRPVFDDRYAPQVRNESRRNMDFRTHQFAMFSHCAVFAANQWLDYGPSVTVRLGGDQTVNLGMSQIIRRNNAVSTEITDQLLFALTKKAVPCTVFQDRLQSCYGSQIIHFNEDLTSDTRFVLTVNGDENQYAQKLLAEMDPDCKCEALAKLEKEGLCTVFLRDADNLWNKPIDVFLVLAADERALVGFIDQVQRGCEAGRFLDLDCVLACRPGQADNYGIALLNTGNIACSVEKGGVLNMMLFHTAEFYGGLGNIRCSGKKFVPEDKSHVFIYSLYPHKDSFREAEIYKRALERNDPLFARAAAGCTEPKLPGSLSFVRTNGNAIVTAIKAGGAPMASMEGKRGDLYQRGITIRCFEPDGVAAETRLETCFGVQGGVRTNLLEEGDAPIVMDGNAVKLALTPYEIETVRLTPAAMMSSGDTILGAQKEMMEPTYIRSWEHDMGSMPMGYMAMAAVISRDVRQPDEAHLVTEVSVVNNYTDQAISGKVRLELPEGWQADWTTQIYEVESGGFAVFPLSVTKPRPDAKGTIRLLYEHDGQQFYDVYEVGYFNPEFDLVYGDGVLKARVLNPTDQPMLGELWIASPVETWGSQNGHNPFGRMHISPWYAKVELQPGQKATYCFRVTGDENMSWYAVGKLCVNGRIRFSGIRKDGGTHCVWAHHLMADLYANGGSLEKLLRM